MAKSNTSLFIRHVPNGAKSDDLRSSFEQFGPITNVYIPLDYHTKEQKGIAYVEFENSSDANNALTSMQGFKYLGAELSVEFAKGERRRPEEMVARKQQMRSKGEFERRPRRDENQNRGGRYEEESRPRRNFDHPVEDYHRAGHDRSLVRRRDTEQQHVSRATGDYKDAEYYKGAGVRKDEGNYRGLESNRDRGYHRDAGQYRDVEPRRADPYYRGTEHIPDGYYQRDVNYYREAEPYRDIKYDRPTGYQRDAEYSRHFNREGDYQRGGDRDYRRDSGMPPMKHADHPHPNLYTRQRSPVARDRNFDRRSRQDEYMSHRNHEFQYRERLSPVRSFDRRNLPDRRVDHRNPEFDGRQGHSARGEVRNIGKRFVQDDRSNTREPRNFDRFERRYHGKRPREDEDRYLNRDSRKTEDKLNRAPNDDRRILHTDLPVADEISRETGHSALNGETSCLSHHGEEEFEFVDTSYDDQVLSQRSRSRSPLPKRARAEFEG